MRQGFAVDYVRGQGVAKRAGKGKSVAGEVLACLVAVVALISVG